MLQRFGGYSAVAKNHAGYFTGLGAWWGNAVRQCAAISSQCHWVTQLGVVGAVAASVLVSRRPAAALQEAAAEKEDLAEGSGARGRGGVSNWMAAAWLLGLTVAVPLYQPYPRLALAWLLAVVIVVARQVDNGVSWRRGGSRRRSALLIALGAAGLYCVVLTTCGREVGCWADRTGLREVSGRLLSRLEAEALPPGVEGIRCAVYVLAEPGLYFHLAAVEAESRVGHLTLAAADYDMARPGATSADFPSYVALGPHADQAEAERLVASGRLEPVAEFDYRPSDLVLLDDRPAWELPAKERPVVERIRLLHVKP
jgi:hypothetical protein